MSAAYSIRMVGNTSFARGAGDKRLFIRNDELDAAWQIFTPVLDHLDQKKRLPELYPYGSRGPIGAHYLAAKYGVRWGDLQDDDL